MGSVRPARRFDALRVHSRSNLRPAEAGRGPPCAFAPLPRSISAAPHRTARPVGPPSDASSPELLRPTTRSRVGGPVARRRIPPSPRATSGVWLPPSRRPPPTLPAREAPERPWASPFEACPRRGRAPLEACALLGLSRRTHPPKRAGVREHLQGLVLATWPGSDPCGPDPRTSLGFSPPEPSPPSSGRSLCFAMPTLPPFGGYTFLPTWVSGPCEATGSAGPSRDCRLSWGFAPSDRHGAPFTVAGGGLMALPRTGSHLRALPGSVPPRLRCS